MKRYDPKINNQEIEDKSGIYYVCLKKKSTSKEFGSAEFESLEKHKVLYLGKAKNLRKRIIDKHLKGTPRNSTLRKSIGALFELKNNKEISDWIKKHILFFYLIMNQSKLSKIELKQIKDYSPPFNLKGAESIEKNKEFRKYLTQKRKNF
ncbi:MAG: hypothetical protein PHG05_03985 [Candidatus Nanoarchaeia archaeon]|nr:hypothetical protein [Candidatus Nanoarchaeia archaeon]